MIPFLIGCSVGTIGGITLCAVVIVILTDMKQRKM